MPIDWLRKICLALPHATEQIQWEDNLVFKIGGKMFAITPLRPARQWLAFKCTHEEFADLTERPGIIPAPYLARAHWVAIESESTLPTAEIQRLIRQSYDLVFAKLTKKQKAKLASSKSTKPKTKKPSRKHSKRTPTHKSRNESADRK